MKSIDDLSGGEAPEVWFETTKEVRPSDGNLNIVALLKRKAELSDNFDDSGLRANKLIRSVASDQKCKLSNSYLG